MKFASKLYVGAAATALCMAAFPAAAQIEAPQDDNAATAVEEIVVTGSRIRRSGVQTPTPTTIINAETIRRSGVSEIADLVNEIPSLFVSQNNQTSNQQGNAGLNALDLRGLGTERTLVLVNGRRRVPAMPGSSAVDISAIPSALVERVDVITGGASALYGADAVAGVANFILKQNYEGMEFTGTYSGSTRGDLQGYDASVLFGRNFHDNRGNVTLFGSYNQHNDAVFGQDRPWTAGGAPFYIRGEDGKYTLTDGNRQVYDLDSAVVQLGGPGNLYTFNPDGSLRRPVYGPSGLLGATTGNPSLISFRTDGGEFGGRYDDWALAVPSERYSVAVSSNYQITENIKLFGDLTYAQTDSKGLYRAYSAYGTDVLSASNPFITSEMIAANGGVATGIGFARRFSELGRQETEYDRNMYQLTVGAEGRFSLLGRNDWEWVAHYSNGRTRQEVRTRNATANGRYTQALNAVAGPNGSVVCADPSNGCVPLNPFKPLTQDVIDFIQYDTSPSVQTLKQEVVSAYVTGSAFDLPAGPVQVVFGAEYRTESNDIGATPEYDPLSPKFDASIGTTATSLVGDYDVAEVFAEVRVPLISNVTGIEDLSFEGAVRQSDYSTAGETTAYKASLNWTPVSDIRFRGTYGQSVRAPNISELFTAGQTGGAWLADPCNYHDVVNRVDRTDFTAANCAAIKPQNVNTYWQWLDVIQSGNEGLGVETAQTYTAGVVIQPRWIPNFSLTVDYFDIELEDAIGSFGAQAILNKCVDLQSMDNMFCGLVERDPTTNNLIAVNVQELNMSMFKTRGIDFEANYRFDLSSVGMGEEAGSISINAVYTKLLERSFILDASDASTIDETVGLFGAPEWKGAVRTTWNAGPWTANWTLRHFSPMRPGSHVTPDLYDVTETDHVFYSDLSASYEVNERVSLYGGLRNAFDEAPPRIPGAEAGGANFEYGYQAGTYDVIGRTFYVGVTLRR
ncbi:MULTISPECIES: TonB-dependent receptor plug domain-containing protein [unclassified Brevundimonas]|uniref:TonB-dependent receptor plug domain-containing protein n=1 Tax=unclassified Brevundimonas TaxID=2622653 RepID=UPI000E84420F|nr:MULTISPECIES: TonB-dependent receptor [unclassified Brevundimonas]HBY42203.1 TonB-dependent outer membrane receptor precursor [Brevundimonas sp.]